MRRVVLILLLLLTINFSGFGYWSKSSTTNNPVCTATGTQGNGGSVSDGNGGVIIVFSDQRNGNYDVYAQRLDSEGNILWTTNGIPISNISKPEWIPQIISDGAGGAYIVWRDERNSNSDYSSYYFDIYTQRIDGDGSFHSGWPSNGVAVCNATNEQNDTRMISDGAGGVIYVWKDYRSGTSYDIYAQRINSSGVAQWTANGVIISNAANNQKNPQIISDGSGGAFIAWEDSRSNGTTYEIYTQRINSSGVAQWTANGVLASGFSSHKLEPRLVADGSGNLLLIWSDYRTNIWEFYIQKFNSSGTKQFSNGYNLMTTGYNFYYSFVISDNNGGLYIAWQDQRNGNYDVFLTRIDNNGSIHSGWNSTGNSICSASNIQYYPLLLLDHNDNNIVVAWSDQRSGNYDIYAQKFNPSGSIQWTLDGVVISDASNNQSNLSYLNSNYLIENGTGEYIIAWNDSRNGNSDIFAQLINPDGSLGQNVPPTVSTTTASSITHNSASSGGDVTDDGGATVTERGVVWGLSVNPTTSSYIGKSSSGTGTGTYSVSLAGLSSNTTYHYRAYAINSAGTSYGNDLTFTSLPAPSNGSASISLNYNQDANTWDDNNSSNSDATVPNGGGSPDGGDGTDANFGNNPTWTFDGTNDCFQIPYNQNSGRLNQNSAKSLFIYFRTSGNITNKQVLIELGGTNSGMNAYIYSGKIWVGIWNSTQRRFFSRTISTGNNFLLSVEYNGTKVRTSLNGDCSSSMLFSGFSSNSNLNGIGASINGTRYMDATTGSGLYNFFAGTIAEVLLYNSCDQTLRESVIDFIDSKYSQNIAAIYTAYFGKATENNTWELNQWEESPMSSNSIENLLKVSQNKSLIKVDFDAFESNNYSLNMYDLNGNLIKTIYTGEIQAGNKSFETEIDQISSGTYIIEVKSNSYIESKNVIIVK